MTYLKNVISLFVVWLMRPWYSSSVLNRFWNSRFQLFSSSCSKLSSTAPQCLYVGLQVVQDLILRDLETVNFDNNFAQCCFRFRKERLCRRWPASCNKLISSPRRSVTSLTERSSNCRFDSSCTANRSAVNRYLNGGGDGLIFTNITAGFTWIYRIRCRTSSATTANLTPGFTSAAPAIFFSSHPCIAPDRQ